ncbi:MAG: rRNA maturation RNase YbeY [Xanthobacteraceae bacterium]|nr:rRNA maturation RNase YbeY [Xanthobacteraceae bacterium]
MSHPPKRRRKPVARAPRNRTEPVTLEIAVRSKLWQKQRTAQSVVRKAVFAAAKAASTAPAELAIVLSHDSAIKALNRDWRGKNTATNVLSFPAAPAKPSPKAGKAGKKTSDKFRPPTPYIGDIVIAYQTTAREAAAEGKPFGHHLAHLAVHGFLHLLGYDHENDRDAETMERLERRILRRLAVPDPYAPRLTAN